MRHRVTINLKDHYWTRQDGTVYSSKHKADMVEAELSYQEWLSQGGITTPYPKDEHGEESPAELERVLGCKPYPPTLEEARADKLVEIHQAFIEVEETGHLASSLGFTINATPRALRDIAGLITVLEASGEAGTVFCDYQNQMQPVTLADLKTLHLEVIAHGQTLYARKWALREQANAAQTFEELAAVKVAFLFEPTTSNTPLERDNPE